MTFRSILSPVSGGESDAAVLQAALQVARTFNGHIDALHVQREPRDLALQTSSSYSPSRVIEATRSIERESEDRLSSAQACFREFLESSHLDLSETPHANGAPSASWSVAKGLEPRVVTELGLAHDLIVISHPNAADSADTRATIEAALFGTGRPVLITPSHATPTIGARILIGWNRTAPCARAVSAAMPFLESARRVVILMVATGAKQGPSPQELQRTLAWNGIEAEVKEVAPNGRKVGQILLDEATNISADLLVMGAYSHSRLRELILGGVTRHVLDHAEMPLLMAH